MKPSRRKGHSYPKHKPQKNKFGRATSKPKEKNIDNLLLLDTELLPRTISFHRASVPEAQRPQGQKTSNHLHKGNLTLKTTEDFVLPAYILFPYQKLSSYFKWKSVDPVGSGLRNLGNTCFLNATLQALIYCAPFANYLSSKDHSSKCLSKGWCLFCELEKTVISCHHSRVAHAPSSIVRNLRSLSRTLRPGRQEDAHEFLRFLMEGLQRAALISSKADKLKENRIKETSILHRIFGGYTRSQVKCTECGYVSNTYEPFLDLSLEVLLHASLQKALQHFCIEEKLAGQNKYKCTRCQRKVIATKRFSIYIAPTVLVVQFKRFNALGTKINKHVEFSPEVNLKPYLSSTHPTDHVTYTLSAVLVHSGGSVHAGHYYSYIKSKTDQWYLMDDDTVRPASLKEVLHQHAYMLFYTRTQLPPTDPLTQSQPSTPEKSPSSLTKPLANKKSIPSQFPSTPTQSPTKKNTNTNGLRDKDTLVSEKGSVAKSVEDKKVLVEEETGLDAVLDSDSDEDYVPSDEDEDTDSLADKDSKSIALSPPKREASLSPVSSDPSRKKVEGDSPSNKDTPRAKSPSRLSRQHTLSRTLSKDFHSALHFSSPIFSRSKSKERSDRFRRSPSIPRKSSSNTITPPSMQRSKSDGALSTPSLKRQLSQPGTGEVFVPLSASNELITSQGLSERTLSTQVLSSSSSSPSSSSPPSSSSSFLPSSSSISTPFALSPQFTDPFQGSQTLSEDVKNDLSKRASELKQFDSEVPTWDELPPTSAERDQRNEILAKLKQEQALKMNKRKRDPYDIEYDRGKQKKVKTKLPQATFGQVNVFQELHSKRNLLRADPHERVKLGDKYGKRGKRKQKAEKVERRGEKKTHKLMSK